MNPPAQPIVDVIWREKYRHVRPDGTSEEQTKSDTHRRVVRGVYKDDPSNSAAQAALEAMERGDFVPAGRIHAGAGTDKRVTWINCFVLNDIHDSMESEVIDGKTHVGILDSLKNAALTQQMGGGIGQCFSPLRPNGAIVKRTGSVSSGVIYFMDMWNSMCATIMSSGSRRGAMMATLHDWHPDLWHPDQFKMDTNTGRLVRPTFISAKRQPGRLTNFNVSVLISNQFMEAVRDGELWDLRHTVPPADNSHVDQYELEDGKTWYVYRRVLAETIWNDIIRSTYKFAEPGIIFIDRVNEWNNLSYCEHITATFTPEAEIDYERLAETVKTAVRFQDNVIDASPYPLPEYDQEATAKRRIGLGITGLGNMLAMLCVRYGSPNAIAITDNVMRVFRDAAYSASIELATERGSFPALDLEQYLESKFIGTLPSKLQAAIKDKGIRNGLLLTIAPTGTTSIYYGNVSSGLEPTFGWKYWRKKLKDDGTFEEFQVEDYAYRLYKQLKGHKDDNFQLPDYFVTADQLTVEEHVRTQAVCQRYIDSSISKTVNCPTAMTFEQFKAVYDLAFELGLKGCTTYRYDPDSGRGAVLSAESQLSPSAPEALPVRISQIEPTVRPEELTGTTYKLKWPNVAQAFYITINDYVDDEGIQRPFEIFINSKSLHHQEWIAALTRTISAVFRRGGDTTFLVDELKQVHSARDGAWIKGKYVPSLVALIGDTLERHFQGLNLLPSAALEPKEETTQAETTTLPQGELCTKCNEATLIHQDGCTKCTSCGHSACG
jgi:ribonucleoside-diphosphate reductase alpha chain